MKRKKMYATMFLSLLGVFFIYSSSVVLATDEVEEAQTRRPIQARIDGMREKHGERKEARAGMMEERQDKMESRKAEMQEKRGEYQEGMQARKEERKEQTAEQLEERVANFANKIETRMNRYNERITNILDKMQSRLDKMAAEEVDTELPQTKLDEARDALAAAHANGMAGIAELRATDTTDPELVKSAIMATRELRQPYKEVLLTLSDIISVMKIRTVTGGAAQ